MSVGEEFEGQECVCEEVCEVGVVGLRWVEALVSLLLSLVRTSVVSEEGDGRVVLFNLEHSIATGMRHGWSGQLAGILGNAEGWQVLAVTGRGQWVGELVRLGSAARWREEEVECSTVGCGL